MITINLERCSGCGACVEACPTGALYLVDGKASVDAALCRDCEACLSVCPTGAIHVFTPEAAVEEPVRVLAPRPAPGVIRVKTQSTPVPWRSLVLPAVGATLAWAGREILPELVELVLDTLAPRTTRQQSKEGVRSRETGARGTKGGARQHRHRRRKGGRLG